MLHRSTEPVYLRRRGEAPDVGNGREVGSRQLEWGHLCAAVVMPRLFAFLGGAIARGSALTVLVVRLRASAEVQLGGFCTLEVP
jgi:hypothetical protein